MSDDQRNTGTPDRDRINLGEDCGVRYWTGVPGVGAHGLREAAASVGPGAAAGRRRLGR